MTHIFHTHTARPITDDETVVERPMLSGLVGEIIVLAAAVPLLASGAITLARAGLGSDLATPVVSVFGYTHTAWLGIAELGAGVLLLIGALSAFTRWLAVATGLAMVIIGMIARVSLGTLPDRFSIEHSYGWFLLVIGVAAIVGGVLPAGQVRRWHRAARTDPDPDAS